MIEEKLEEMSFNISHRQEQITYNYKVVTLEDAVEICKSEIAESCKKQREICADQLKLYVDDDRIDGLHKLILNAPSPEVK